MEAAVSILAPRKPPPYIDIKFFMRVIIEPCTRYPGPEDIRDTCLTRDGRYTRPMHELQIVLYWK
ncbi:hypothetical protein TcasGA2_TC011216 [Tribolium castaneum]|uniref:Uncharacterized protein n=1 Tax=Tribolium castaneum TaxID=7070 RepID=D6X3P7_TRICA|nr:hypothetical protein TcasGA2_TC011216 [Tribolium castaneum]